MNLDNLDIVCYPDPVLRQDARPITEFTPELAALAQRMIELMVQANGVGLAAPQVGIDRRLFVASPTGKAADAHVYINPVLSDFQGAESQEEGCLSLPGITVKVNRPTACHIEAVDINGNPFSHKAAELLARILQHENDHLNGVLIVDKMNTLDRLASRRQLKYLEQEYQ